MKVGIMSMQRVVNYGSFLQSYSLKKNIEKFGAEVEFVDYMIEPPIVNNNKMKIEISSEFILKAIEKFLPPYKLSKKILNQYWEDMWKVDQCFCNEMLPMLGISEEKNYRPKLDLLVIGSDEVFNCLQTNEEVGYSRELFGKDNNAKKVITYAASFGNTIEEGLKKYNIYDEIKGFISKFDALSARDKNTLDLMHNMCNINVVKNVDPVFLYDYDEETKFDITLKDYIVVYAYNCRIGKKEARAIKKIAKKHMKKIVCLCGPQRYLEGYIPLNPFEILAYVRNADYVITDTFHGTVFSIKYNKQFATIIRSGYEESYGNKEKIYDLLETFDLKNHMVENLNDLEDVILFKQDYTLVNEKIRVEAKNGKKYLENNLK